MYLVTEEIYGFKYMFSEDDEKSHLMVIRAPRVGFEPFCKVQNENWGPSYSTIRTCKRCAKAKAEYVPSDSETSEES